MANAPAAEASDDKEAKSETINPLKTTVKTLVTVLGGMGKSEEAPPDCILVSTISSVLEQHRRIGTEKAQLPQQAENGNHSEALGM
ncbi:hypothetical protein IHE44_0003287 [Lamprotornis superbus]|uniref:Uncharacterized protein n=1 Tax=Lamprotornis superbus TaxID=245042 RepID=A0A835NYP6_9PASS|nr:hypothetical protein IHE44_0003287 [Lamprotornis superbus]